MVHKLFCLSFVKFELDANRLRIKCCVGISNLFLSDIWAWYSKKQPNLKKWVKIEKKRPLSFIAAKLTSAGIKLFWQEYSQELWDCNRVGHFLIPILYRLTTPILSQKNAQKVLKVILLFIWKGGKIRPWFCDFWIAR